MDFATILAIIMALLTYSGARRAGVPATVAAGLALGAGMATKTIASGSSQSQVSTAAAAASVEGDATTAQVAADKGVRAAKALDSKPTTPGVLDTILGVAKEYPIATVLGAGAAASVVPSWLWMVAAAVGVYIIIK